MSIHFRPLMQIDIAHGYYSGPCEDLEFFVMPGDPAIAAGRLLPRVRDGRLVILFEADETKAPLRNIAGSTLWIGLRLNNPSFANFTTPPVPAGLIPLFANRTQATSLDAPVGVRRLAARQRIVPQLASRPLTLRWQHGATTIAERILEAGEDETVFETRHWPDGELGLSEIAGGRPLQSQWLVAPALAHDAVWGVVAITIDAAFYTSAPTLTVSLSARSEVLKYYLVTSNFSANEFGQIQLTDAGAAEQSRPALAFDKVLPVDFTADDIPASSLGGTDKRIALFRSQVPVARRAGGYRKLQLKRNTDILVQHLPQAGADRAQAHFIVHLAKS